MPKMLGKTFHSGWWCSCCTGPLVKGRACEKREWREEVEGVMMVNEPQPPEWWKYYGLDGDPTEPYATYMHTMFCRKCGVIPHATELHAEYHLSKGEWL